MLETKKWSLWPVPDARRLRKLVMSEESDFARK